MFGRLCIVLIVSAFFVIAASAQEDKAVQPTVIIAPKAVYPKEAKDAGIGGKITVRVMVGESGEVLSVDEATGPAKLCKGGNNDPRLVALRNSVIEAVKQAKFSPGMKDGKPVKATIWLNMTFDPSEEGPATDSQKKVVRVGVVTGKALRLPKPDYPGAARASRAGGPVTVRVVVDEKGDVFSAEAVSGHPLLRSAAVSVACDAKFSPTEIEGKAVRVTGVLTYNFWPGR